MDLTTCNLVKKRLVDSTLPTGTAWATVSGHYLTKDVVDSCISFFESVYDLLPQDPYIYSTLDGDGIWVEFHDNKLTLCVTLAFIIMHQSKYVQGSIDSYDTASYYRLKDDRESLRHQVVNFFERVSVGGKNGNY